jgi:hypothetical protein
VNLSTHVAIETPFHVWLNHEEHTIRNLAARKHQDVIMGEYAYDLVSAMGVFNSSNFKTPLVAQFGDLKNTITAKPVPVIGKWRHVTTRLNAFIIWKLNVNKHYGLLKSLSAFDRSWERKKQRVIWRGVLSGFIEKDGMTLKRYLIMHQHLSDYERCNAIPRCKLVYMVRALLNNSRIDAALTSNFNRLPRFINGTELIAARLKPRIMLKNKVLLSIEGNDVATNLKWALYSNSVVMGPPPTKMTYGLENLLVPWVHFIPLHHNFSDLEEKMEWVWRNDADAKNIAMNGKQFMQDLMFGPEAKRDDEHIQVEMAKRYAKLWGG